MTKLPPALAVIDGSLCELTREGARRCGYAPLATAVVEFCDGLMSVYVREHPYGLLPGIPNLYCLDRALRLQWLADWPASVGPCTRIIGASGDVLLAESESGAVIRLDAQTGRLCGIDQPMAAAG